MTKKAVTTTTTMKALLNSPGPRKKLSYTKKIPELQIDLRTSIFHPVVAAKCPFLLHRSRCATRRQCHLWPQSSLERYVAPCVRYVHHLDRCFLFFHGVVGGTGRIGDRSSLGCSRPNDSCSCYIDP